MKETIKITVWVKFSEVEKFNKIWNYLFDNKEWYLSTSFNYKQPLKLYTQKMIGDFVELQLNLDSYLYWLEKTKNE